MIGYAGHVSESDVMVVICRDSAEAALIRAVLTAHEIPVVIRGGDAAMIGGGSSASRHTVWVPPAYADEAAAFIRDMREGGAAELADDEIPEDDTAEREEELTPDGAVVGPIDATLRRDGDTISRLSRRNRITLAFLAGLVLMHGTAHMSARAWKRGFLLAAVQIAGWWTLAARDVRLGGSIVIATIVMDLVGAVTHILQSDSPIPTAVVRR